MIKPVDPANWIRLEKLIAAIDGEFGQRDRLVLSDISFAMFYHYLYGWLEDGAYKAKRNHCLYNIMNWLGQQEHASLLLHQQPFHFNCLANVLQRLSETEDEIYPELARQLNRWNSRLLLQPCSNATLEKSGYLSGWAGVLHYYLALPEACGPRQQLLGRLLEQISVFLRMYGNEIIFLPADPGQTEMGLAEGISGILLVLIAVEQYQGDELIRSVVEDSVHQLIGLRQEVDQYADKCSFFPYQIDTEKKVAFYDNRLGWQSSDLGHALLLCRAGVLCRNQNYGRMAEMVALNTLLRKSETHTGIYDATLQQGAAGVARLYKQLFEYLQNKDLINAYHSWIACTMELADRELEAGRFIHKAAGLLDGLVGIALTLIAYENENTAGWSKTLLI